MAALVHMPNVRLYPSLYLRVGFGRSPQADNQDMYSICQIIIVLDTRNITINKIDTVSLGEDNKDF